MMVPVNQLLGVRLLLMDNLHLQINIYQLLITLHFVCPDHRSVSCPSEDYQAETLIFLPSLKTLKAETLKFLTNFKALRENTETFIFMANRTQTFLKLKRAETLILHFTIDKPHSLIYALISSMQYRTIIYAYAILY